MNPYGLLETIVVMAVQVSSKIFKGYYHLHINKTIPFINSPKN